MLTDQDFARLLVQEHVDDLRRFAPARQRRWTAPRAGGRRGLRPRSQRRS